jgi:hypothetical protein
MERDLMKIRRTSDNFNGGIKRKEVESTPRADGSAKLIKVKQQVCYSTEELLDLKGAVERTGGKIREILPLRNGHGMSCVIEMPGGTTRIE